MVSKASRRPSTLSIAFKNKVAQCLQNPLRYKAESDVGYNNDAGKCAWWSYQLGASDMNTTILDQAWYNANGYSVADPNTGLSPSASVLQQFFQTYVKTASITLHVTNVSSAQVNLTFYAIRPRLALGSGEVAPATKISFYSSAGSLPGSATSGNAMTYEDVRFTPYMCKYFTALWRIDAVKHVKLAAGQTMVYKMDLADYKLTYLFDGTLSDHEVKYRPGKMKAVLVKQWGIDSSNTPVPPATADYRTSEGSVRVRQYVSVDHSRVADTRPIVYEASTAFPTPSASRYVDPVQAVVDTVANINT